MLQFLNGTQLFRGWITIYWTSHYTLGNLIGFAGTYLTVGDLSIGYQATVVQTLDSAIHRINHYPLDNSIGFASVYPLDSDLSGGQRYPSFEQLGPVT